MILKCSPLLSAAVPGPAHVRPCCGFNLYTWANNHTIDWNLGGILTTKKHLDAAGVVHAGCGINLEEAAQPRYLDLPQGRVAIIGVTSTMNEWGMASNPRRDVLGRPGANVLRYQTVHKVRPKELDTLRKIVDQTEVNADRMLLEKEGFNKPLTGGYLIGKIRFEATARGEKPGTVTTMNKKDADRIVRSIEEAKRQADFVFVSHHSHERKGMAKNRPADFCRPGRTDHLPPGGIGGRRISAAILQNFVLMPGRRPISDTAPISGAALRFTRISLYSTVWAILFSRTILWNANLQNFTICMTWDRITR